MEMKKSVIAGLITASLLLSGCENQTSAVPKPSDSILNSFQKTIADKNNDFGFNLYRELSSDGENIMISPTSVAMDLTMAYNGAQGDTKEAMAEVLKVKGYEIEELNKNNQALLYLLSTADPKVTLSIANSVWLNQDFEFASEFTNNVEAFYHAASQKLDFNDSNAANIINKWVKKNTQGLITEIVEPPVDPSSILFLINAVYFKGEWTHQFDKNLTSDQTFFTQDDQSVTVPTMYQSGSFSYFKGQNFQALRLPYGEEDRMAMVLFLPDEDSSLEQFQSQLNSENWAGWLSSFEEKQGTLMLPKFSIAYEKTLNQALTNLGLGIAFESGKADFSGMATGDSSQNIFISEVKHKTFLQVDEAGTEAAAVTSTGMTATSMPEYDFELKFNRPFFYAIQDSQTGAIVFMGAVQNPSN
ncbi:serpin family protein [Acetobacterium tundrae]|uniref:Serpin family protein n=2 Tax=Acetobacterium tundrae TaxID=132932 RepID=A0ABR6WII2_9FIRM|nr:serpin family protein [Acetobacterium tundrae]